jgi:hypothetical protein
MRQATEAPCFKKDFNIALILKKGKTRQPTIGCVLPASTTTISQHAVLMLLQAERRCRVSAALL